VDVKLDDFRVVLDNRAVGSDKPVSVTSSHYIVYVGQGRYQYVAIGSRGKLVLSENEDDLLRFRDEGQARRRLAFAIEQGDFAR
jgi:hypothetical protein